MPAVVKRRADVFDRLHFVERDRRVRRHELQQIVEG